MTSEAHNFRVGLFVLTGVVLVAATVVVIGGGGGFIEEPLQCETYFDESVQGLEVGSPVKFRGVKLGVVSDIGLVNDYYEIDEGADQLTLGQRVLVRMEITTEDEDRHGVNRMRLISNLSEMIKQGLRLRLTALGITGLSFIEADYVAANTPYRAQYPWTIQEGVVFVPSAPSNFKQFTSAVERVMHKLESVEIDKILLKVDELLERTNDKLGGLNLGEMQAGVLSLVKEMRETNARIGEAMERGRLDETADSVRQTIDAIQVAVDQASSAMARLEALIESGAYDATAGLENFRVATQSLRDLVEEARGYPSHTLFGDKPPPPPVTNR